MMTMFTMRICFVLLAFGLAASSLTLTAKVSRSAPRQAQEQGGGDSKDSSSATEAKEIKPEKKVAADPLSEYAAPRPRSFKSLGKEFLLDQEQIWTSPAKIRFSDTEWLVPLSGIAAGLFVTDSDYSRHLSQNPTTISHYKTLSDAGVGALIGGASGMWLLGHVRHNEHWSETGFLAGEAALNSLVAVEAFKYSLRRERPYQGDGTGPFFQSGGTSFPSEHAAAAWSVAGVIAHEYPSPFMKIMAYGLASLVDYSRIRSRQHFPSDVFVGSMMGNLIGQNIYSRNHDPGLGGEAWRSWSAIAREFESAGPQNLGSPYVPLDSWVYPVLDRLAGLGLIDSSFVGLRPWTRRECMRQLNEAEENLSAVENSEAQKLIDVLQREFRSESETRGDGDDRGTFRLESVYSRTENISGMPLTDGYTFAQTQINDFGRPYGQGWNTTNGFSAYAMKGPWIAYVRGEEQSAPSIPAYSLATREVVQQVNVYPTVPPGTPQPSIFQFKLLDAYFGLMVSNWQVTFGKQSLSWGPGDGGSLTLSDNAQPINMFRISRTTPLKLPSFLGWLGPIRTEFFLGQLAGYEFILSPSGLHGQFGQALGYQPLIHGQKLSFKPTRNFEFGVFRTTIFGGEGYPFTWHALITSLFTTGDSVAGSADKPGKRTSGLDLIYRLPHLRNWLTFYADGLAYDEFSPIAYADRSAWRAGLYFSHFPSIPKLDLRIEGVYTDNPLGGKVGHGFYYFNATWKNGYTNNGYILGSWIGREGQGAQAWMNYWFTPKNRMQIYYRHQKVSQEFIPGGGTLTDVGLHGDVWTSSQLSFSGNVQYETWNFPVIRPGQQTDVSASLQVTYWPRRGKLGGSGK
jgi:membrane-associated phospholipid phosphatase